MLINPPRPLWRRPWFLISGLILVVGLGAICTGMVLTPRRVTGTIRLPDTQFRLRDGRATWQPDTGWLTLYLYPHRLRASATSTSSPQAASSASSHLVHRSGGSAELTLVFNGEKTRSLRIETAAFAVSSPHTPDASRIFMQGHRDAPWVQAISLTNGPGGGFVSLVSSGACSDEVGRVSWTIQINKLALEVEQ